MKTWQPFIVIENIATGPAAINSHTVVLRVNHTKDLEVFQGHVDECYKYAYSLNEHIRRSLYDFVEGM